MLRRRGAATRRYLQLGGQAGLAPQQLAQVGWQLLIVQQHILVPQHGRLQLRLHLGLRQPPP